MGYRMQVVHPQDMRHVWHLVEDHVGRACKYSGTHDADSILESIMGRRALLWMIINPEGKPVAHIITEVVSYPCKNVVLVVTTGGRDFKKWQDVAMETLLKYQEETNSDGLQAICRPGMVKWLIELGWTTKSTIMEFDPWAEKAEVHHHQHSKQ